MMDVQSLRTLADSYPPSGRGNLVELARRYESRREQEILDIAVVATDVSADSILNLGLEPESNPLLIEAFQLQYPNVDPATLVSALPDRLSGIANGVKGKYFEVLVRERLNSGERLGEVSLIPGQVAQIAESSTRTGWDLQIINTDDGTIVEQLQLKATTYVSPIKQALDKYPDIRVATTSDIYSTTDGILRTNISNQELEEVVQQQLGELSEDTFTDLMHQTAEWAFDTVPIVPVIVVAVTEGRTILLGRSSLQQGLQSGVRRLRTSAAFSTLGATLVAVDAGVLSIPTTAAARVAWGRIANRIAAGGFVQSKTEELRLLAGTNPSKLSIRESHDLHRRHTRPRRQAAASHP